MLPAEDLITKGAVDLEDGKIYIGQWNSKGEKEGFGTMKWDDKSCYEGDWVADNASGWGKMLHSDGDIYEGYWQDGMSNGFGTYTHADGAQYMGQW